ncbi:MAG: hypothetical protein K6G75_06830 [Lachnospiraceae bacterium]|nr:hypothetical protein [Lachnospiraceae bacterium]
MSHVGSWGEYGTMYFSERNNLILGYYMGMGYEYESYNSLAYQEPVVIQVYENNAGTGEDNIFYSLNGCVVSEEIYSRYLNK